MAFETTDCCSRTLAGRESESSHLSDAPLARPGVRLERFPASCPTVSESRYLKAPFDKSIKIKFLSSVGQYRTCESPPPPMSISQHASDKRHCKDGRSHREDDLRLTCIPPPTCPAETQILHSLFSQYLAHLHEPISCQMSLPTAPSAHQAVCPPAFWKLFWARQACSPQGPTFGPDYLSNKLRQRGFPLSPHRDRTEKYGGPARHQVAQRCSTSNINMLNYSCKAFSCWGRVKLLGFEGQLTDSPRHGKIWHNKERADWFINNESGEMKEFGCEKQHSKQMCFSPSTDLAASCDLTIEEKLLSFLLQLL